MNLIGRIRHKPNCHDRYNHRQLRRQYGRLRPILARHLLLRNGVLLSQMSDHPKQRLLKLLLHSRLRLSQIKSQPRQLQCKLKLRRQYVHLRLTLARHLLLHNGVPLSQTSGRPKQHLLKLLFHNRLQLSQIKSHPRQHL